MKVLPDYLHYTVIFSSLFTWQNNIVTPSYPTSYPPTTVAHLYLLIQDSQNSGFTDLGTHIFPNQ